MLPVADSVPGHFNQGKEEEKEKEECFQHTLSSHDSRSFSLI